MVHNEIYSGLKKIFNQRFEMDIDNLKESFDTNLLGREFKLVARDLLYLFFDIEMEFGIAIPEDCIAEGKFNTINNIAGMIEKELSNKKVNASNL